MSSTQLKNIRERLIAVVNHVVDEARRFKSLEEATGISAATWRTFWNRKGNPSGEMIETISAAWPQFAFWLATGITDGEHGHIAPEDRELPATTAYFIEQIQQMRARSETGWKRGAEDLKVLESAIPLDWQKARLENGEVRLDLLNLDEGITQVIEIARQRRLEELKKNREEEATRSKQK